MPIAAREPKFGANFVSSFRKYTSLAMTIEEEIKQAKFKSAYHKLAINIMYSSHWLETYLKKIFKKEDITLQQYNILRILRGSRPNPLSTLQIRERMMDRMSDTSRIVDRMIVKGIVSKTIREEDNRLVDVRITEKGLKLLSKLDGIEDNLSNFLDSVSENEAIKLSDLLDKLHSDKQ